MAQVNVERVSALMGLAEDILDAVKASGLLKRKPGRKRKAKGEGDDDGMPERKKRKKHKGGKV